MKNYVTLPQNTLIDSTAMATLTLTIKVPDNKAIDMDALKLQVEAIANAVVAVPSILKKKNPMRVTSLIALAAIMVETEMPTR